MLVNADALRKWFSQTQWLGPSWKWSFGAAPETPPRQKRLGRKSCVCCVFAQKNDSKWQYGQAIEQSVQRLVKQHCYLVPLPDSNQATCGTLLQVALSCNPKTSWFISQHSCHLIWKNVCTRTDLVGGIYGSVGANRRHSDLPVARRQRSWLFLKYHYAGGRVAWTVAKQSGHIWQCLLVEGTRRSMACLVRSAAALHFDPSSSCWARCWSNPSQEHSFLWPWRLPTGLEAGRCGGTKYAEENFLFDDGIAPPVCYFFLLIASSKLNLEPVSSNKMFRMKCRVPGVPCMSRMRFNVELLSRLRIHEGTTWEAWWSTGSARWSPDCAVWRRVA